MATRMNFAVKTVAMHIGMLIDATLTEVGMNNSEFARRLQYARTSIPSLLKRKEWNTGLIDRACIALKHNFYLYKAKEIAAELDPTGASEPVVPYESANWKAKYQEQLRTTEPLIQKVKMLEMSIDDKNKLIAQQEDMLQMFKRKEVKNGANH